MKSKRPCLYFSFRSPYSWIAMRRLEELCPQAPEIIEYQPYWEPDDVIRAMLETMGSGFHYAPMSKTKHLYILRDIKNLTEHYGCSMTWPVDVNPRWDTAHLAWLAARRIGQQRPLFWALHEARWEQRQNIWDPVVIEAVANSAELDGPAIVKGIDDANVRAEAVEILARAYDQDVFGVPFFLNGRQRFWGLDRLEAFIATLPPASPPSESSDVDAGIPKAVLEAVGCYDTDTAGGCG